MLFNSWVFIFAFLPLTLAGFYLLLHYKSFRLAAGWLCLCSLFFYGYWNPIYLLLLSSSIIGNYAVSRLIAHEKDRGSRGTAKIILALGIIGNILVIAYFKYTDFLIGTINQLAGLDIAMMNIVLPLAISFVTFQKIAFLVDCYRGLAREKDFLNYLLFVTFFPQLIAGPIVHYREIMPQFMQVAQSGINQRYIAMGMALFAIGLLKKCVFADLISVPANTVYDMAEQTQPLAAFDAWFGAVSYSYQIYFDFSGYSDMAIGLALLFGVHLPVNFFSPYQARNFIDFWRRWHITLSRFLRDYIYFPLGGARSGLIAQIQNIMITMFIGGLWHGASWNFVLWGVLHGGVIGFNHIIRRLLPSLTMPTIPAIAITFLVTTILWVFFRAESFAGAIHLLQTLSFLAPAVSSTFLSDKMNLAIFTLLTMIIFFVPSSMQLLGLNKLDPEVAKVEESVALPMLKFDTNLLWVVITSAAFVLGLLLMQTNIGKQFIYFDF